MTQQRICAYERCSERFIPKRPHQRFHAEPCRYAQWELDKAREAASGGSQRVDGGVGSRGGNVRGVDEARQLQTASKALDRWRLVMEEQIFRTLLGTGRFHVDDLDCLDLPPEAFEVRGTLVNAVRRTGVMCSTNVTRKVAHKAANARKAPIYEITAKGREQLPSLVGLSNGSSGHVAPVAQSGENPENVGLTTAAQLPDLGGSAEGERSGEPGDPNPASVQSQVRADQGRSSSPSSATDAGSPASSKPEVLQLDVPRESESSAYGCWETAEMPERAA